MALSSLRSLARNADTARLAGLKVELIAILDKPDPLTLEVFQNFANLRTDIRVEVVDMGDLGFARNKAAALASGKWISFLDADDIWADRWLVEAFTAAENDPRQVVWHPEVNVYFGARAHLFLHGDMDEPQFNISTLAYTNLWTALAFVSAEFLRKTPYAGTNLKQNIGYEDWSWNIEVVNQAPFIRLCLELHTQLEQNRCPCSAKLSLQGVLHTQPISLDMCSTGELESPLQNRTPTTH